MIAKDLFVQLLLTTWSIEETASEDIDSGWLKEHQAPTVVFTDGLVDAFVCREEVLVVDGSRQKRVTGTEVHIVP